MRLTDWNSAHDGDVLCEQNGVGDCDHVHIFATFFECLLTSASLLLLISTEVLVTLLFSQQLLVKLTWFAGDLYGIACIDLLGKSRYLSLRNLIVFIYNGLVLRHLLSCLNLSETWLSELLGCTLLHILLQFLDLENISIDLIVLL